MGANSGYAKGIGELLGLLVGWDDQLKTTRWYANPVIGDGASKL